MRIGSARPSSALLGAAEPVATRTIFVSVKVSLRGTPCRRENWPIPGEVGLFSGQERLRTAIDLLDVTKVRLVVDSVPSRIWALSPEVSGLDTLARVALIVQA